MPGWVPSRQTRRNQHDTETMADHRIGRDVDMSCFPRAVVMAAHRYRREPGSHRSVRARRRSTTSTTVEPRQGLRRNSRCRRLRYRPLRPLRRTCATQRPAVTADDHDDRAVQDDRRPRPRRRPPRPRQQRPRRRATDDDHGAAHHDDRPAYDDDGPADDDDRPAYDDHRPAARRPPPRTRRPPARDTTTTDRAHRPRHDAAGRRPSLPTIRRRPRPSTRSRRRPPRGGRPQRAVRAAIGTRRRTSTASTPTVCRSGSPWRRRRYLESGNDYGARAAVSSASGAYQVIDSFWNNYGGYPRAYLAPPAVQDQFAYESFVAILKR